ncbi:MAG: acyltransferase [Paracoccus sp. (in: a-proteobacteria)]|nr:acyltransferase [Paracoccus sp. (in: a-proteobacteria)]MDO5632960.1 acyltransferase [Paracoccus sp. (in: a-proteobacteria)]
MRIARVLCIVFMMTTHIWPGWGRLLAADHGTVWNIFTLIIVDYLGRASVPFLSLVSGILFVYTFRRKNSVARVLADKFMTLILPMALWSIPALLLLAAKYHLKGTDLVDWPNGLLAWTSQFLSIHGAPANGPLHFLREIFLCCLYATAVLLLLGKSRLAGVTLAVVIVAIEMQPQLGVLFRWYVAAFFLGGVMLAAFGRANWTPGWGLIVALLAADVLLRTGIIAGIPEIARNNQEILHRLALSMLAWRFCASLANGWPRVASSLKSFEPYVFVIFCSHMLTITIFAGVAMAMAWHESQPLYPLMFAAQLVACIVVGIVLTKLLQPFPVLRGKGSWTAIPNMGRQTAA